jgi:hypothetical protein
MDKIPASLRIRMLTVTGMMGNEEGRHSLRESKMSILVHCDDEIGRGGFERKITLGDGIVVLCNDSNYLFQAGEGVMARGERKDHNEWALDISLLEFEF